MKPAWDQLMKLYEKSEDILIADVDCTAEGEQLCADHNIEGYPTLKYGAPDTLNDYEGAPEFENLLTFAKENLGPCCGPGNMEFCDDEHKAKIEAIKAKGLEKIEAEIDEFSKFKESTEETFYAELEKLQALYDKLTEERDEAVNGAMAQDFMLLEKVNAHLQAKEEEFLEVVKQEL